ncbi:bifunctional adenosylcobinamide kinase/adenosylcobinamide-phosphate guanylyltransferase [Pelagibius sp.]|uniref:bifunctional adenosylcobinamide kinase/adenosylcobinamide-phosphate guanylyltransferase n=1 Tax=Pelagibius sp. TaxID=1931238 RepID=UPI003B5124A8
MTSLLLPPVTLVLGGARSGKSRYAENLVESRPGPWVYLATATAGDAEMAARIAEHQRRRGGNWQTREAPLDLVAALRAAAKPESTVLVDCLTLWLSNILLADLDVHDECEKLVAALAELDGPVVFVSNEVGLGIVPENALARRFRDAAGRLNQAMAAAAQSVVFVAAGLPLVMKAPA